MCHGDNKMDSFLSFNHVVLRFAVIQDDEKDPNPTPWLHIQESWIVSDLTDAKVGLTTVDGFSRAELKTILVHVCTTWAFVSLLLLRLRCTYLLYINTLIVNQLHKQLFTELSLINK